MDINRLRNLIEQGSENQYLDFKIQFHENKAELLHDILCLANNTQFQDAYLVFGINDRGETIGVESQPNRIKLADMQGLLHDNRSKFFDNALPEVDVAILSDSGHEIDVLEIKSTLKVPYFLTECYKDGKITVRSGHVYSRTGDRNTPINQCASTDQTIKLWEKRFGRLENQIDKFLIYLDDLSNWKKEQLQNENSMRFYYEPEPMLIIERTIDFDDRDSLPYYQAQPYGLTSIYRGSYKCIANQIVIESGDIYSIDDARSIFTDTEYYRFQNTQSNNLDLSMDYYLKNSISFKLLSLFNQNRDGYSDLGLNLLLDQTVIFSSQNEVNNYKKYVKEHIQDVIKQVEGSSKIGFKDAPYDRRKHDIFRIHTGRVLKEMHSNLQLKDLDNND